MTLIEKLEAEGPSREKERRLVCSPALEKALRDAAASLSARPPELRGPFALRSLPESRGEGDR